MKRIVRRITVLAGSIIAMNQAAAVPIWIDFTDSTWSSASDQLSFSQSYAGVDVTVAVTGGGLLTFNADEARSATAELEHFALGGDGIGVRDDEIGAGETVEVSFSSNVTVLGYALFNLFDGEGPDGVSERADSLFVTASGSTAHAGYGSAVGGAGLYWSGLLDVVNVSKASFWAGNLNAPWSDFALAGMLIDDGTEAVTAVPEPSMLVLFASGLLAVGLRRKFTR